MGRGCSFVRIGDQRGAQDLEREVDPPVTVVAQTAHVDFRPDGGETGFDLRGVVEIGELAERGLRRQQLVHQAAQRPHVQGVRKRFDLAALELAREDLEQLGSDVALRSTNRAERRIRNPFRRTEIRDFHQERVTGRDENVLLHAALVSQIVTTDPAG